VDADVQAIGAPAARMLPEPDWRAPWQAPMLRRVKWLARLRRRPRREALLNDGLALAMNWGDQWLAPIQERLQAQHPWLAAAELDDLDAACQAAMRLGHETAYRLAAENAQQVDPDAFIRSVRARFAWVDDANAERLLRQSVYYLWKAGGPPRDGA
jgi:hypothetical protein